MVDDAHQEGVLHPPMMQTTDISMKVDPSYGPITKHFHQNPQEFHDAWVRWVRFVESLIVVAACMYDKLREA